jgi:hypothetical protein
VEPLGKANAVSAVSGVVRSGLTLLWSSGDGDV